MRALPLADGAFSYGVSPTIERRQAKVKSNAPKAQGGAQKDRRGAGEVDPWFG
jgi:hypothetical protein